MNQKLYNLIIPQSQYIRSLQLDSHSDALTLTKLNIILW